MNGPLVKKLAEGDLSLPGLAAVPDLLAQQQHPLIFLSPVRPCFDNPS
jgi:hypothetical protein